MVKLSKTTSVGTTDQVINLEFQRLFGQATTSKCRMPLHGLTGSNSIMCKILDAEERFSHK